MKRWVRIWFGLSEPIDRATYFLSGIILAAVKYGLDAAMVARATGKLWTPLDYLNPVWSLPLVGRPPTLSARRRFTP